MKMRYFLGMMNIIEYLVSAIIVLSYFVFKNPNIFLLFMVVGCAELFKLAILFDGNEKLD